MLVINNEKFLNLLQSHYTFEDIQNLSSFLQTQGTLQFPQLDNGLFAAAILTSEREYTQYARVWVRDNIYVAYSHYLNGQIEIATRNVKTLMAYFHKYQRRLTQIIAGQVNPEDIMKRPHVRFEGRSLEEVQQEWNHAQNDALGYFLWLYCQLAWAGAILPEPEGMRLIALFPTTSRRFVTGKMRITDTGKKSEKSQLLVLAWWSLDSKHSNSS